MHKPILAYTLALHHEGRALHRRRLTKPVVILGRDPACDLVLASSAVSRRHAEIRLDDHGAQLRDTGSQNGVKVNGLPRVSARLHDGDRLEIGPFTVVFHTGFVPLPEAPVLAPIATGTIPETVAQDWKLPAEPTPRHLRTLQQAAQTLLAAQGRIDCAELLPLLRDAFRAQEVHLYSPTLSLQGFVNGGASKPVFKVRSYLVEQFQQLGEATPFSPIDLHRFQERAGEYYYLVAPLRAAEASIGPAPLLVFLRPAEWLEFNPDERALLHLIVQLWARLAP